MNKQTKPVYKKLREFAEENKCDAVLLTDGTIKRYLGERHLAVAIYKIDKKKLYMF